jgi:alkylation response protein AidB-like acyl-CoA dehydrogenase
VFLDRTSEQQELAAACRNLLAKQWPISLVDKAMADGPLPRGLWGAAVEMGWLHVLAPLPSGLGLSAVEAGAVSEEAGRALFPGALIEAMAVGALGVPHPAATTLAPYEFTDVVVTGNSVSGTASAVPYGDTSDHVVLRASGELWSVGTKEEGVTVRAQPSVDVIARPCRVEFDRVPALRVGDRVAAVNTEILMHCLIAARLLGLIDAVLERSALYAREREQFGRSIGGFQAVQQLLADLKKRAVATRSVCYASQAAIAGGRPDAARWASAAKAYATASARRVTEGSIQVHGGIGFTTELPLHLYLKQVLSLQSTWGSVGEHERDLARAAVAGAKSH